MAKASSISDNGSGCLNGRSWSSTVEMYFNGDDLFIPRTYVPVYKLETNNSAHESFRETKLKVMREMYQNTSCTYDAWNFNSFPKYFAPLLNKISSENKNPNGRIYLLIYSFCVFLPLHLHVLHQCPAGSIYWASFLFLLTDRSTLPGTFDRNG